MMQDEEPSLSLIREGLEFPNGTVPGDVARYEFLKKTIDDLRKKMELEADSDYSLLTEHRDHLVREDYLLMYAVCVAKIEDPAGYYEGVVMIVTTMKDDSTDDKRKIVESIPFKVYFARLKEVIMMGESEHFDPERLQVFDEAGSFLFQDCVPDWRDVGTNLKELTQDLSLQLTPSEQWDISMHGRRTYKLFTLLNPSSKRSVRSSSQLSKAQGSRSEQTSLFTDDREFDAFVMKTRERRLSRLQRCEPGRDSLHRQLSSHSDNSAVSDGTGNTWPVQDT